MAKISAFCGLRYDEKKLKHINKVFAPPYDVISSGSQKELCAAHPQNIVRLTLGKIMPSDNAKDNRYTRAAGLMKKWMDEGILVFDEKPSLYIYTQEYTFNGKRKLRVGYFARIELEDKGKGALAHEHTLAKPKVDRLMLTRAVEANLGPVFSFFIDKNNSVEKIFHPYLKRKPLIAFKDKDNIRHRFWKVDDKGTISRVRKAMSAKDLFIADGHHRYEVSNQYREEIKKKGIKPGNGANYVLMYLTAFNDSNLSVMPTHRLVNGVADIEGKVHLLQKYFCMEEMSGLKQLLKKQEQSAGFCLGMYYKRKFYLLTMNDEKMLDRLMKKSPQEWRRLDVAMLNQIVFAHIFKFSEKVKQEKVGYTRDIDFAVSSVNRKKAQIAFFPKVSPAEEVKKIALSGSRMPQKSTYFYPKPLTGLVINKF